MVAARKPDLRNHPALIERDAWGQRDVPAIDPERPVDLNKRTHAVYVWIWRYVQLYGKPAPTEEIAAALGITRWSAIVDYTSDLHDEGCIAHVDDGWVPVRQP